MIETFGEGLEFWKAVSHARQALLRAVENIDKLSDQTPDILAIKDAMNEIRRAEIKLGKLERSYYAGKGVRS